MKIRACLLVAVLFLAFSVETPARADTVYKVGQVVTGRYISYVVNRVYWNSDASLAVDLTVKNLSPSFQGIPAFFIINGNKKKIRETSAVGFTNSAGNRIRLDKDDTVKGTVTFVVPPSFAGSQWDLFDSFSGGEDSVSFVAVVR